MRLREKNNNWRGGRSIASNGYVLIRVGVGHHLADVRGYAYEHRIVAEQKLGRTLNPGEVVHHIDGNRQNNDLSNIEVWPSNADHLRQHSQRHHCRAPGEDNPQVDCLCGCGQTINKYDRWGRPRKYVSGHNKSCKKHGKL
jgi:hypothetical protein